MRLKNLAILISIQFGLCACEPVLPSTSKPATESSEVATPPVRVIVSFNKGGPANDPELMERIRHETSARAVLYIGQSSPHIHIFSIQLGQGQSSSSLLQALKKIPTISSVEIDSKVDHH